MSDETFAVELAGRRWELPHLPFRAIKAIQPALFQIYSRRGRASMTTDGVARLGEKEIERLAEAIWRAIAHVDPALSFDDFLDLPFSVGDLIQAFPSVAKAAGLRAAQNATAEASPEVGKIDYDALIAGSSPISAGAGTKRSTSLPFLDSSPCRPNGAAIRRPIGSSQRR